MPLLSRAGISRDSSIVPAHNPRYGIPNANRFPHFISANGAPCYQCVFPQAPAPELAIRVHRQDGLAVIDFSSRVSHIHDSYKAGDDWCREMFIESSSFAASTGVALAITNYGTTIAGNALACLLAATPAGWVLVLVGIGVAAAAAGTSIWFDKSIKENAGSWYDSIMKWTNAK